MSKLMEMKRFVLVLLVLMLSLGIGVYSAYANEPGETTESNTIISGSGSWQNPLIPRTEEQPDTRHTILSTGETAEATNPNELKLAIQQGFIQRQTSFSIHYTGDTSNIEADIKQIINEIFADDDYLNYSRKGYGWKYEGCVNDVTISFTASYVSTREQEDYVEQQVPIILARIISSEMSTLEKVKGINDYIVLNTAYSDTTIDPSISPHSAFALLKEGQGVCQGYALLAYKMLQQTGIPVRIIVGNAGGGGHAWNLVEINGHWYHLDVTWNDPTPNRPGQVNYNYFLRNNTIADDHSWDTSAYPATTDNSFAYFHVMLYASSKGENIYYSHQSYGNQLYRSSMDGTEQQQLNNNRSYYITVAGNWIYYSNYSYGGYLYKIQTDGSDESLVVEEYAINTYVKDNILYYTHVVSETNRIDKNIPLNLATYSIATIAEPVEGGIVSGAGSYLEGDTVSLTAIPNIGYAFTKWTENGTGVSTDAKYTFMVNSNRNLTAEFQMLSNDATLSSIEIDGNNITGFSSTTETYNVELPYGTTAIPEVTAVATDTKAIVEITPATTLLGTTKINVTAEDGFTIKTYKLSFSVGLLQQVNYKVYINGNEVQSEVGFYEYNNIIYGPLRCVADAMGLQVCWDAATQQATFEYNGDKLVITIDSFKYSFNGVEYDLPGPVTISDGRTLIPIKTVVDAFGGTFRVDKGVQALTVNEVDSGDATVTGVVGTSGATITVRVSGTLIGTGTSQQNGSFVVTIPSQAEGTALEVNATDGIDSKTVTVIVKPSPLPVNRVNYKVYINGNEVQSDVGFYEYNNVVLGPLRSLAEAMMLQVEWNGQNQQIIISLGSNTLVMSVNSTKHSFNDVKLDLPIQPTIIDNRTLVPLQVIVEAFGGTFRVDKGIQALTVNEVNSGDTTVTGVVGTSGATITVRILGTVIGTGTSQQNGSFVVTIPSQAEGTALEVNATDGIDSKTVTVIVKPSPLPVNRVNYKVYINGNEVQSDVGFYAYNNIIYGPLRCVADAIGLEVGWDAASKQIIFVSNGDTLIITIDSLKYSFNGVEYDLPGPATIYNGRTLIPIKTVVEAFGGTFRVDTPVDECFIATAAFGSKFNWPVMLLRNFRDKCLLTNDPGKAFVAFYYRSSPPIAEFIAGNEPLKLLVRCLLAPLVGLAAAALHPVVAISILLLLLSILLWQKHNKKFIKFLMP